MYLLYCLGQFLWACVTVCQTVQEWNGLKRDNQAGHGGKCIIPALKNLRQEDCKLKGTIGLKKWHLFSFLNESVPGWAPLVIYSTLTWWWDKAYEDDMWCGLHTAGLPRCHSHSLGHWCLLSPVITGGIFGQNELMLARSTGMGSFLLIKDLKMMPGSGGICL